MKDSLKQIYVNTNQSFIKIFLILFLTTLAIAFAYEFYKYGFKELDDIASKTKISIVFKKLSETEEINNFINIIKNKSEIKTIEIVNPIEAKKEFLLKYGNISKDLFIENPFPTVIYISMKSDYFDSKSISQFIHEISSNKNIDEIRYKKEFVDSFSLIRNHVFDYIMFFSIVLIAIFIFVNILVVKPSFELKAHSKLFDPNSNENSALTKLGFYLRVNIIVIISVFFSLILTDLISLMMLLVLKDSLTWLQLINMKTVFISSIISGSGMVLVAIFYSIFHKLNI